MAIVERDRSSPPSERRHTGPTRGPATVVGRRHPPRTVLEASDIAGIADVAGDGRLAHVRGLSGELPGR